MQLQDGLRSWFHFWNFCLKTGNTKRKVANHSLLPSLSLSISQSLSPSLSLSWHVNDESGQCHLLGLCRFHFGCILAVTACRTSAQCMYVVISFRITIDQPRRQGSWGQHWAHLGPVGSRWAPCWPHEPCYQGDDTWQSGAIPEWFTVNSWQDTHTWCGCRQKLSVIIVRNPLLVIHYRFEHFWLCNQVKKIMIDRDITEKTRAFFGKHYFVSWGPLPKRVHILF